MDKIEKIRQEIERRLKYTHDWLRGDEKRHPKQIFVSKNYYKMKGDERTLDALLSFLDTLSEEPSENLKEAADAYAKRYDEASLNARAYNAFKVGAEWQKSQMMNEAVKADVNTYELTPGGSAYVEFVVDMPVARFKFNDKVRIIIVKEESNGKK